MDTGLFKTLKDEKMFKSVRVAFDTIEWANGVDLDPEVLYEKGKIKNNGNAGSVFATQA
jgi:hypothetical protein